jgi:hypothetical protein
LAFPYHAIQLLKIKILSRKVEADYLTSSPGYGC